MARFNNSRKGGRGRQYRDTSSGLRPARGVEPGDHHNATGVPSREDHRMAWVAVHKLSSDQSRTNREQARFDSSTRRTYLARERAWNEITDLARRNIDKYGGIAIQVNQPDPPNPHRVCAACGRPGDLVREDAPGVLGTIYCELHCPDIGPDHALRVFRINPDGSLGQQT